MKILISDVFLKGKSNSDWKEGYELFYAFKNLGYECDIAGVDGDIPETEIPKIDSSKFESQLLFLSFLFL